MQAQQPVIRQSDQQIILQQPAGIVIKMNEPIQQITPVGKFKNVFFSFLFNFIHSILRYFVIGQIATVVRYDKKKYI